jgi:hypothetical protein
MQNATIIAGNPITRSIVQYKQFQMIRILEKERKNNMNIRNVIRTGSTFRIKATVIVSTLKICSASSYSFVKKKYSHRGKLRESNSNNSSNGNYSRKTTRLQAGNQSNGKQNISRSIDYSYKDRKHFKSMVSSF